MINEIHQIMKSEISKEIYDFFTEFDMCLELKRKVMLKLGQLSELEEENKRLKEKTEEFYKKQNYCVKNEDIPMKIEKTEEKQEKNPKRSKIAKTERGERNPEKSQKKEGIFKLLTSIFCNP